MMFKQLIQDSIIVKEQYIKINAILGQNLDIVNNELKALIIVQNELKNDDKGYFIKQAKEIKESSIILEEDIEKMNDELTFFHEVNSIDQNFDFSDL